MGFFDFFRTKDAAYFLEHAQKALSKKHWAEARNDAQEGLAHPSATGELEQQLRETLKVAYAGIFELNITEAEHSMRAGDFTRALECLDTARIHAADDAGVKKADTLTQQVKDAKANAQKKVEIVSIHQFEGLKDEEEARIMDEFEVYLASLVDDVAERYRQRGYTFAQAYVAMNSGDPKKALDLFATLKPRNDEDAALLSFEQSRVMLMVERFDRALQLLDVVGAIRGSQPIFLSNHPSVAYLRHEALLGLRRPANAVKALEEGLKVYPKQLELRNALAQLLLALNRLDEANAVVQESMNYSRTDGEVFVLRARVLTERGKEQEAIETLEHGMRAVGNSPTDLRNANVSRALAELYIKSQTNQQRAAGLIDQIFDVQNGEGDWTDYLVRARLHLWQGDERLAREDWRKAKLMITDPRDPRRAVIDALFPKG